MVLGIHTSTLIGEEKKETVRSKIQQTKCNIQYTSEVILWRSNFLTQILKLDRLGADTIS